MTVGLRPRAERNSSVGQHAAVDLAGRDVAAAAVVDLDRAGRSSTRRCSASLLISRIWPIVGSLASGPKNGFLPAAR